MPSVGVSQFHRKTSEAIHDEEVNNINPGNYKRTTIAKSASVLLKAFFFSPSTTSNIYFSEEI